MDAESAIRSAHEAVRRSVAHSFNALEKREEKIAEFDARRRAAAAEDATLARNLRRELDDLLPDELYVHTEVARTHVEVHNEKREAARRDATAAREAVTQMALTAAGPADEPTDVRMSDWFWAPAHRASLAHEFGHR